MKPIALRQGKKKRGYLSVENVVLSQKRKTPTYTAELGNQKKKEEKKCKSYIFPFLDKSIAIQRVASNWANIILHVAISGTARNAPASHQKLDQITRARRITNELRFSLSPISFGSITFAEINCGMSKHARSRNEVPELSNTTKLYKKGSMSATIAPITGMKSSKNTSSANIRAYSKPKKYIMIQLIKALKNARENFERKNTFISW